MVSTWENAGRYARTDAGDRISASVSRHWAISGGVRSLSHRVQVACATTGADIVENTRTFMHIIESYARRYPDRWFWLHRRWKQRL